MGLRRDVLSGIIIGAQGSTAPTMLESLGDYPRWLVVVCVTIVLAAVIWIGLKLLKVALWMMLVGVLIVGLSMAAWMVFQ